ncbi:MAG: WcaI family glycosyltransferase [Porticoccaceae bacterium]
MKFVLYGLNYAPELSGIGKYTGDMEAWFSENAHQVDVLTSPPYYPEWSVHSGYRNRWFSRSPLRNGTVVRCPLYVPSRPSTFKRLVHLVSFSVSSGLALSMKLFDKPDFVICIQPTLFCAPLTLLYARLTGAKAVMHVQDYEIDAMFGLDLMRRNFLSRIAKKIESWLMRRFDLVTTISYSMIENAKQKGVDGDKLRLFPNWADVSFVTPSVNGAELKVEWGFCEEDKIVLYAGNIGKKQGLDIVIEVAEQFRTESNTHFVLVGDGVEANALKSDATTRDLPNVHFKPLQSWSRVPEMLALADVHLVIQKCGAADVVLPSKLTNILSAGGHAIVTAEKETELGLLTERFPGIYTRIDPEDSRLLGSSLRVLLNEDLSKPNMVARNYALEYLSRDKILTRFESDLEDLLVDVES